MPRLVWTEEGRSGGNSSGEELRSACPWQTRYGACVRRRGRGRRRAGRAERRVRALWCSPFTQAGAGGAWPEVGRAAAARAHGGHVRGTRHP